MDVFTALNPGTEYSKTQLQLIIGAWVLATPFERKAKVSLNNGDVAEEDYDKRSIYSLLYSLYRTVGTVKSEEGEPYEFTFNTWAYKWPDAWGDKPTTARDPERFGKNAYTGLFHFKAVQDYIKAREGRVHIVEMGCGTGAGAHHVSKSVLPNCTYEAVDMQQAAIQTCKRKFVPQLGGRLKATRADCTKLPIADGVADFVAVCETHVTEFAGQVTEEDAKFFRTAHRLLKPGGMLVWGNAIPDSTWQPCFEFLESIGMKQVEVCDVTKEAIAARDEDKRRADDYVDEVLRRMWGFRIPRWGTKKRVEARQAMLNFYRNPGTRLYDTMTTRTDTYKVACFQKTS
ncbi:MAG: class I SAM-dependent methyltransferase [Polyangiaceae bacterium]|jgi:ubiquinone/menaquinone biosynthesis C-methylase UbiE